MWRILYPRHIALISNAIDVASICGIESIIIGKEAIRGIHNHQSVCILHKEETVELPFTDLGINQVDRLTRKFDMAAGMDDLVVNVVMWGDPGTVRSIVFTGYLNGKKTVFDHGCPHPARLKAPDTMTDTFPNTIKLPTKSIYEFLVQASKAGNYKATIKVGTVGSGRNTYDKTTDMEMMNIRSDEDGITLVLRDQQGAGSIGQQLHDHHYPIPFAPFPPFNGRYSLKVFMTLLKLTPQDTTMGIGEKGVLKMNFKGLDVFLLPMAGLSG